MDNPLESPSFVVFSVLALIVLGVLTLRSMVRRARAKAAEAALAKAAHVALASEAAPSSEAPVVDGFSAVFELLPPDATPVAIPGPAPNAEGAAPAGGAYRTAATDPRAVRAGHLRARLMRGLCRYCDQRATHIMPRREPQAPRFDWVYRLLNVAAPVNWTITVEGKARFVTHTISGRAFVDYAPELCAQHHALVRARLEHRIAKSQADLAAFVDGERQAMHSFESYELDALMDKEGQLGAPAAPAVSPAEPAPPSLEVSTPRARAAKRKVLEKGAPKGNVTTLRPARPAAATKQVASS